MYQCTGCTNRLCMQTALMAVRDQDPVLQFVEACMQNTDNPDDLVKQDQAWAAYVQLHPEELPIHEQPIGWAERNKGKRPLGRSRFYERMRVIIPGQKRTKRLSPAKGDVVHDVWLGWKLLDQAV